MKNKIKNKYRYIGVWLDVIDISVLIHLALFIITKDNGLIIPFIAGAIPSFFVCLMFQFFLENDEF